MKNSEYHRLYEMWKEAGFPRNLSPSVDRIDVNKGYSLDNIQFLTMKDNVAKSHVELKRQKEEVTLIKGDERKTFPSHVEASIFLGVTKQSVDTAAKLGTHSGGWRVVSTRTPKTESGKHYKSVLVVSNTDELTFPSVREAALFLGITESTLRTNIRKGYTIKKQYIAKYGE